MIIHTTSSFTSSFSDIFSQMDGDVTLISEKISQAVGFRAAISVRVCIYGSKSGVNQPFVEAGPALYLPSIPNPRSKRSKLRNQNHITRKAHIHVRPSVRPSSHPWCIIQSSIYPPSPIPAARAPDCERKRHETKNPRTYVPVRSRIHLDNDTGGSSCEGSLSKNSHKSPSGNGLQGGVRFPWRGVSGPRHGER